MKRITQKSNTDVSADQYPFGKIRDKTLSQSGTPVNADVYTDIHQFFQSLFEAANIQPNGLVENGQNGFQIINAIGQMISRVINPMVLEKFVGASVLLFDYTWEDITYGNGYYVRVGYNTGLTEGYIATSRDGISHSLALTSPSEIFWGVAAGDDGKFMAVGTSTGLDGFIYLSTDYGVTFNKVLDVPGVIIEKVVYAGGDTWGMTTGSSGVFLYTTDNGATVNSYSLSAISGFVAKDIAFGNGKFCLVGKNASSGTDKIVFTTDGTSFSSPGHDTTDNDFISVVYAKINEDYYNYGTPDSDKGFLAITDNGASANTKAILGDSTGLETFSLSDKDYKSVAYGNGKIVMISEGEASDANIEQTFDLFRNTQVISNSLGGDLRDMVYGSGKFVMCGDRATTPLIQ